MEEYLIDESARPYKIYFPHNNIQEVVRAVIQSEQNSPLYKKKLAAQTLLKSRIFMGSVQTLTRYNNLQ